MVRYKDLFKMVSKLLLRKTSRNVNNWFNNKFNDNNKNDIK